MPPASDLSAVVSVETFFCPPPPQDSREVITTFAIAARVACVHVPPVSLLTQSLIRLGQNLVPPDSLTFEECKRLWDFFARVAQLPKAALRQEAGRALFRELDGLCERLDMRSLPDWNKLPDSLVSPLGVFPNSTHEATKKLLGASLKETRHKARAARASKDQSASEELTGNLLRELNADAREALMKQLVGGGLLTRSEVNLLVRYLAKEKSLLARSGALFEILTRLGLFLSAEETA